jgi:hypothetical protein
MDPRGGAEQLTSREFEHGWPLKNAFLTERKGQVMSRRAIVSLAASVIIGIASISTVSTDAFAYRKGVHHRKAAVPPAAVAVVVAPDNGPVADRIPRCFDSAIYYPYPPCY